MAQKYRPIRPIPPIPKPMPPGARRRPFPLKSCASNCLQPAMRPQSHAICKLRRPSGPHGGVPHRLPCRMGCYPAFDTVQEAAGVHGQRAVHGHQREWFPTHASTHAACAYKHARTRTQTLRTNARECAGTHARTHAHSRAHTGCRPYTSIISWKGFMRLSAPSPLRGKSSWYLTTSMQPTKLYLPDRTHLWNVPMLLAAES